MSLREDIIVKLFINLGNGTFDEIDFTSAAVADWSHRHGRPNITQPIADYLVSVTFVRQEVEAILAAEGRTLDQFCQLGNKLLLDCNQITAQEARFYSYVTDVQRTRNTITLSGVDGLSFTGSAIPPREFTGWIGPMPDVSLNIQIENELNIYPTDFQLRTSATTSVAATIIVGQTVTSVPEFLSTFWSWAPTNWIIHNRRRTKIPSGAIFWDIGLNASGVDRPFTLPTVDKTITDDMVIDELQYSRNVSDIATSVTCTNSAIGATYTVTDTQLVDLIGYRSQNIDAIILYEDLQRLAGVTLAGSAVRGAPVITFQTTYKLANFFFWSPNLLLDVSAVTSPEFAGVDKVWIENVDARIIGDDILFTLTVSDANYSTMLQRWQDVPGVRTWAQLPASQTWAETLTTPIT